MHFADQTTSVVPLPQTEDGAPVSYLALEVEPLGFMYVLSYLGTGTAPANYRLDIYDPDGAFVSRTTGVPTHQYSCCMSDPRRLPTVLCLRPPPP